MTWLSDSSSLVSGAWLSSEFRGHGVRGDAIPPTGAHGPAPLYAWLSLPADAANEYRWAITTPPAIPTTTPRPSQSDTTQSQ